MENHPIPQDVTGFKFKLIGSVTVKQFLYLLGFGILATVAFILHANFIFVRVPLMILFAGMGLALAFMPIEGRPMDLMIVNFAKAVPAENRFIFRKRGVNLSNFEIFQTDFKQATALSTKPQLVQDQNANDDKRAILVSRLRNSAFRPDDEEMKTLSNINTFFKNDKAKIKTPPPEKVIQATQTVPDAPLDVPVRKAIPVDAQPVETSEEKPVDSGMAGAASLAVEQKLRAQYKAQQEQERKDQEAKGQGSGLKLRDIQNKKTTADSPQVNVSWNPAPSLAGGFPSLPDIPNIILGIVKDPRGKSLPNVLVEVVDANNIPVRAFKTNALGQFSSATPLPNGQYKISFEDPQKQHEFPPADVSLTGDIFQPIEAVSTDAREKLRRELFDAPTN